MAARYNPGANLAPTGRHARGTPLAMHRLELTAPGDPMKTKTRIKAGPSTHPTRKQST